MTTGVQLKKILAVTPTGPGVKTNWRAVNRQSYSNSVSVRIESTILDTRLEMAVEDEGKKGIKLWKDFMCPAVTVRPV
jgi:hypothetical protein